MYIKDNQEKISGLTAIDHMVKGKLAYSPGGAMRRIKNNRLEFSYDGVEWKESRMLINEFLNPSSEWYAEPVFDVREELLNHPGKWVAKYFSETMDRWEYIGFDTKDMSIVAETDINAEVSFSKSAWLLNKHDLKKAVPLDQSEELALKLQ